MCKVPCGEICVHRNCRWMRPWYRNGFKIHIQNSYSLTLFMWPGMSTILILQQPYWSTLCEVLQSVLGTTAVPAGSVKEKHIGIPNLNLIILFQQVPGDWPPPCFSEGAAICFQLHRPSTALDIPWTQREQRQRSTSCWHAPSRAGLRNAATSCLGQKGHKRTLIPHLAIVGHVSWVAHPKEMLSAAKECSYVIASRGWACCASLRMSPLRLGSPGTAGSSQAAPLLVPDHRPPRLGCSWPVWSCSRTRDIVIYYFSSLPPSLHKCHSTMADVMVNQVLGLMGWTDPWL